MHMPHIYMHTCSLVFHTPQYTYVVMCILGTHKYTEHTHASVFFWTIIYLDVFVLKEGAPVITHTQLSFVK